MSPRPARKPLNTYHHGDLRDALVQAALQQVELGGPEAVSISALAKKLGVSQPAPYRHFADRETLLTAVTAEAFRQFSATLRESIGKPSTRSKLSRFALAMLDFGLRRNGIYRLMFASRTMACACWRNRGCSPGRLLRSRAKSWSRISPNRPNSVCRLRSRPPRRTIALR